MSPFTVRYAQRALDQLTDLWLGAGAERDAVTEAANEIDKLLASDPSGHGKPEHEGLWRLDVPPLHVLYTIEEQQKIVGVELVRWLNPSSPGPQANGEVQRPDEDG